MGGDLCMHVVMHVFVFMIYQFDIGEEVRILRLHKITGVALNMSYM